MLTPTHTLDRIENPPQILATIDPSNEQGESFPQFIGADYVTRVKILKDRIAEMGSKSLQYLETTLHQLANFYESLTNEDRDMNRAWFEWYLYSLRSFFGGSEVEWPFKYENGETVTHRDEVVGDGKVRVSVVLKGIPLELGEDHIIKYNHGSANLSLAAFEDGMDRQNIDIISKDEVDALHPRSSSQFLYASVDKVVHVDEAGNRELLYASELRDVLSKINQHGDHKDDLSILLKALGINYSDKNSLSGLVTRQANGDRMSNFGEKGYLIVSDTHILVFDVKGTCELKKIDEYLGKGIYMPYLQRIPQKKSQL